MSTAGPLLIDEDFVAYFPSLGRALGSVEDAVLVQMLWFRRDRETNETALKVEDLADAVGMNPHTAKKRSTALVRAGVLSKRRASSFDATSVWTVNRDVLQAISAGQPREDQIGPIESAKPAPSEEVDLALSDGVDLVRSSFKKSKNQKNTPKAPAGGDAEASGEALFDAELDPRTHAPNGERFDAQFLIRAWYAGYREAFGTEPDPTDAKKARKQCEYIAKDREEPEDWQRAWRAANNAGKAGRYAVGDFLANDGTGIRPKMHHERVNDELQRTARRMQARYETQPQATVHELPAPQAPTETPQAIAGGNDTWRQTRANLRAN